MRPTVKLGEICEIERGGSPRPIQEFLTTDENGINWIKIGDTKTQPKYIEFTQEKIKPEGVKRSRMVYPGDFILSNSMSFGRPYIMKTSGCIHDGRLVLRPDNRIDKEFLYYLLGSEFMYKKFENSASGTGVKNLNIDKVNVVEIPLPPLETQKAIVAKLDQIFAELDQTKSEIQKNLDNTDELWKSALNQAFQGDWEMKKLGEVAGIQNGGTPKTEKKEYWDGDILWITPKDMGELNSKYVEDTSRKISKLGLNNSSAKLLPINSVILSSRAPIGYIAINTKPISTNQGCKGIIPNDNLKAEYLYYFLILSNKFLNSLGSGATFKELSSSKLGEVKLPVPPLSEQEKIVEHLDQVSKEVKALKSQYQSQLDNLEELRKSVLDKAFRGEIGE